MLPAERGDMGEQLVRHLGTGRAQVLDGAFKVHSVPERDRGGDQGVTSRFVRQTTIWQT